jgi:hypothetical protein
MTCGASKKSHKTRRSSAPNAWDGVTLIELAIGMMILIVLSLGVSALVKTGVETQMSRRSDMLMQTIGLDLVDDLRFDVRTTDSAAVSGGGNTLTLSRGGGTIVYQLDGNGRFSRTDALTGAVKVYNDPAHYSSPAFRMACPATCFTPLRMNSDATPSPREIRVNEIRVQQVAGTQGGGTFIDRAFGLGNFSVRAFTFSVLGATEFQ